LRVEGPGFRALGSRFRVWGVHVRGRAAEEVKGLGFKFWGVWFRVQGSGFRVQGSGFMIQGSGFRMQG